MSPVVSLRAEFLSRITRCREFAGRVFRERIWMTGTSSTLKFSIYCVIYYFHTVTEYYLALWVYSIEGLDSLSSFKFFWNILICMFYPTPFKGNNRNLVKHGKIRQHHKIFLGFWTGSKCFPPVFFECFQIENSKLKWCEILRPKFGFVRSPMPISIFFLFSVHVVYLFSAHVILL